MFNWLRHFTLNTIFNTLSTFVCWEDKYTRSRFSDVAIASFQSNVVNKTCATTENLLSYPWLPVSSHHSRTRLNCQAFDCHVMSEKSPLWNSGGSVARDCALQFWDSPGPRTSSFGSGAGAFQDEAFRRSEIAHFPLRNSSNKGTKDETIPLLDRYCER